MNNETIDVNSITNQDIKGKFVGREVYCNVNSLVEYCLNKSYEDSDSPINSDEIENYYSYPEYYGEYAKFEGGTEEERDAEIERLQEIWEDESAKVLGDWNDDNFIKNTKGLQDEMQELRDLESEGQEIFEWWAVSRWLFDKLKEKGEPVVDAGSCYVWGRTTTGQAILLDGVISEICEEMEILQGQTNDWSRK